MGITCRDLLELETFRTIKLVAGKDGLSRRISWPYVKQTDRIAQWVNGGELLFVMDGENFENLVQECIEEKICALVVLVGGDYIDCIPQKIIDVAEQNNLPVFEMPWDLKILDVTREVVNLLMLDKQKTKASDNFMNSLFNSSPMEKKSIFLLAEAYNIDLLNIYFVAIFDFKFSQDLKNEYFLTEFWGEEIKTIIEKICIQNNAIVNTVTIGSKVIFLISVKNKVVKDHIVIYIENAYEILLSKIGDNSVSLGIGRLYADEYSYYNSYYEACRVMGFNRDGGKHIYEELGIFKLFLHIENREELKGYYKYKLGRIIEYDMENKSSLLQTLHMYLENNCNLIKTAENLFIHRNTLVYRLGKIKEILETNLDSAKEKQELYNCILAKEFLGE